MLSNSLSVHIFANAHTYIYSFSHITHFTHTCQHAARAPDGRLRLSSHRRRPRIPWPACGRPPAAPAWPLCPTTQPKSAQPAHTRSQRHARRGILPPCAAPSTCTQPTSALLLSTKAARPAECTQKPNSRPRTCLSHTASEATKLFARRLSAAVPAATYHTPHPNTSMRHRCHHPSAPAPTPQTRPPHMLSGEVSMVPRAPVAPGTQLPPALSDSAHDAVVAKMEITCARDHTNAKAARWGGQVGRTAPAPGCPTSRRAGMDGLLHVAAYHRLHPCSYAHRAGCGD